MGVIDVGKGILSSVAVFRHPVPGARVSSPYGWRNCPFHGREFHRGVDLAAGYGTPIYATAAGTVTVAGYNRSYGNTILINHGNGWTSRYAHASKLLVRVGQKVSSGQQIAKVGSTGQSTGNHCHFEIMKNGATVNPMNYIGKAFTGAATGGTSSGSSSGGTGTRTTKTASGSSYSGTLNTQTVQQPVKKEITTVVVKSTTGTAAHQTQELTNKTVTLNEGIEIMIQNKKIQIPCLEGDVTLERSRMGGAAILRFTVIKDSQLNFQEGNPVSMRYNGENIFFGYVFSKSRKGPDTIDVTCYDQIRYLKSQDTMSYTKKTYADLIKMVANDYGLTVGNLEDTKYVIPSRIEECTILDMLYNASDLTVFNTGNLFVLYDDYGKLTLQNIKSMKLPIVIDAETATDYSYKSTIDDKTYNRVKLAYDNDTTGQRETYIYNGDTQAKWGVLQYYEKLDSKPTTAELKTRGETLLKYYNLKHRNLTVKGAFGDIRVRGGSSLVINLNLGDMLVSNYMVVETVKHRWKNGQYEMDLTLAGIKGEFTA